MSDFNYFLNRQGPRGMQGEKGEKGNDGNTPTFYAGVDSGTQYTLIIDMGDGNTFETSNLMPTFVNTGGTYLRYDTVNNRYVSAQADMADLSGNVGEVKLATTTSVANETVQDSDAVSYELFRQSGGGGGTSFIPGTGLELTNADVLNVKIDNSTITTNSSGQLVASGGGATYTAGNAIDLTGDAISVKYDNSTIKLDDSGKLKADFTGLATTGDLAGKADAVHTHTTSDITDFPTIGNGTVSVYQDGTLAGTFTMNQTGNTTINLSGGGGGGGGTTYAPGTGIDISAQDVISVKYDSAKGLTADGSGNLGVRVDSSTIDFDSSGNLKCTITPGDTLPSQSGNSGKFLTTDGSATSWATVSVPSYSAGTGIDITSGTISIDTSVVAELSDIPDISHMVTDNTAQTISAKKTLTDSLVMSGLNGIYYKNSSNNETFLIGKTGNATQGFGKIAVGVINDALELRGSGARPQYWPSGGSATDLALLSDVPDTTYMVTTNTTQTISGTKTFSTETHFTGNITFDSAFSNPLIRGMDGSSYRNMITRSNTYSKVTAGNTSDNLILKGALTRPQYSHDSSDGGYLALYSDIPGDMTGAAAGTAGAHGLVPAPAAGDNEKFLRGDGTWQTVSGGSSTDVQINGSSITAGGTANIVTEGVYNASTNKIATMDDVPTNCISSSEVSSPLEYTTSTIGVQKFNYTGSTGAVSNDFVYGVDANPPSDTFQYISELTNGVNFITTAYLGSSSSTNEVQSIINLGTYSNGTFTTIIPVKINSSYNYVRLFDDSFNQHWDVSLSGYPARNNAYETNDKTVFCLSYNSTLQRITAAYSTPNSSNNNLLVYGNLNNVNSTNYPDLITKLGQCTHIQVAFINNGNPATVTSMNIDNMVLTNPSTSYASSLDTSDSDCLIDAVAVDTNLYTTTITNHNLILNYDSATLDVDNGALKVKDNTFITEASLQTVHCVVETYQNGVSYYRLYDDGWAEQIFYSSAAGTFNWLIPYSDANYYVFAQYLTGITNSTITISAGCWCYSAGYIT